MNKTCSLLEDIKTGWRYIYKGKKAHCFKENKSLCSKYIISDYETGGLLHKGMFYKGQLCPKCLLIYDRDNKS